MSSSCLMHRNILFWSPQALVKIGFIWKKIAIVMMMMMMMKQPTTADLALDPGSPLISFSIKVHLNSFKSLFKSLTQFQPTRVQKESDKTQTKYKCL